MVAAVHIAVIPLAGPRPLVLDLVDRASNASAHRCALTLDAPGGGDFDIYLMETPDGGLTASYTGGGPDHLALGRRDLSAVVDQLASIIDLVGGAKEAADEVWLRSSEALITKLSLLLEQRERLQDAYLTLHGDLRSARAQICIWSHSWRRLRPNGTTPGRVGAPRP